MEAGQISVSNGIKFSFLGGKVWLKIDKTDESVLISVKDEGLGVSKEEQAQLFNRFTTGSTKSTAGETNTGLGLSIVKRIADELGMTVSLISEKGKGTEVYLKIN